MFTYILNELDFVRWREYYYWTRGGPTSYRFHKNADKGTFDYTVQNSDNYYVVIYVLHTILGGYPARIYSWTIKHGWQETTCDIQISAIDPQGASVISHSITQRDVEKRFKFNAQETGMYKIVLKNLGAKLTFRMQIGPIPLNLTQSNTNFIIPYVTKVEEVSGIVDDEPILLYVRIEAFQPPISAEFFGVSENLVAAEQQYVNSITNSFRGDTKLVGDTILNWVILSSVMIALFALAFSLNRWKPPKANSSTELALN